MQRNKKYNIEEFYVGELYLYTNFANFISESYNPNDKDKIKNFSKTRAINFQQDMESRYIDWENGREYVGFLTLFYKQGNKYICLHDGITYEISGANFIKNLVPLNELLPKVNSQLESCISTPRALELFDILFKNNKDDSRLYSSLEQPITDFYVGDITLREIEHQEEYPDSGYNYINLPHHIMLNEQAIHSFEKNEHINTTYRCLFLRDGVDLYNVNNHQFYNPNEDAFQMVVKFKDYIGECGMTINTEQISIPKALKKFKKTIQ